MPPPATSVSTRTLRENLRETLEQVAKGKEVVITLRGKPYVRLVPIAAGDDASNRYPLRGSVLHIADDFDEPMPEAWGTSQKRPSRPAKARASSRPAPSKTHRRAKK